MRKRSSNLMQPFGGYSNQNAALVVANAVLLALALVALALAPAIGSAQEPSAEPKTTLPDVEDEVMCPVCGTTLELASDAKQANDQRELIRDLIAQGLTKEEIKDELVSEFGEEVLATPSTEGFDLAAWIVPGVAVLAGGAVAFVGLRRWRGASVAAERERGPPSGESAADQERLDEDLRALRALRAQATWLRAPGNQTNSYEAGLTGRHGDHGDRRRSDAGILGTNLLAGKSDVVCAFAEYGRSPASARTRPWRSLQCCPRPHRARPRGPASCPSMRSSHSSSAPSASL